ncbi:MAG TPA: ComEC family competence protein, partial [Gammaproteobacteria bacterium]
MITIALAVLCGTLCLQWLPQLPAPPLALPLVCILFACACVRRLRAVAWCAAAFLLAWWQAEQRLALDLPAELEGRDVLLRGTIVSLPEVDERATRFVFQVRELRQRDAWTAFTPTVRLSWFAATALSAGQGWQLQVRLKRRHGLRNPGGFDYAGWLFQNGVAATGYVRAGPASQRVPALDARRWNLRLRAAVAERLQPMLTQTREGGLLRALTVGAADGLSAQDWEVFRATGTGHLVSISGLHIGLVAGLGFVCGRWLWSRSHRLTQRFAAPRAAALAALLAATLYAM